MFGLFLIVLLAISQSAIARVLRDPDGEFIFASVLLWLTTTAGVTVGTIIPVAGARMPLCSH